MPTPEDYENVIETLEAYLKELSDKNEYLLEALDRYENQTTYLRDTLQGLAGGIQWY